MMTAVNTTIDKALIDIFHLENIKYVISVDDCFASSYADKLRQELIVDFSMSHDKVMEFLRQLGKDIDDISQIIEFGGDAQSEIQKIINSLSDIDVQKYADFDPESKSNLNMKSDKEEILYFLEALKDGGVVEGYSTFQSTHEAEKFYSESIEITGGSILWLIDRNFENVGESSEAGLEFAKNRISKSDDRNFFFFLTKIGSDSDGEKEIDKEFDNLLVQMSYETPSLVYYIAKDKLLARKYDKVAQSLANGFNRKLYFKIIEQYCECLHCSCENSIPRLHEIRRAALSYIFFKKVESKGESYFDFFARLVQIFHNDEYSKTIANKRLQISMQIKHFVELVKIIQSGGSVKEFAEDLIAIREKELFDTQINKKHCEISSGDIFKIGDDYYILATQSCDTFLRTEGERRLKSCATLLKIVDNNNEDFRYELSCFKDEKVDMNKPSIIYRDYIFMPFEILDLCVASECGIACIKLQDLMSDSNLDIGFTTNYKKRYDKIKEVLCFVHTNMQIIQSFFYTDCPEYQIGEVKNAYENLSLIETALKKYRINDEMMIYDVRRISRLNELETISMLNGYSVALSRVGKPFDIMEDDSTKKQKK